MAILDILHFPDARLRNKAKPVVQVDDSIRRLVDDMFETMYQAPGIGLAATQVNVAKQVIEPVQRAAYIRVRALDREGRPFELQADDLLAVCIQHEMDHLEGKLFVDYLSSLKRQRIRKRLEKEGRQAPVSTTAHQVI